MPTRRGRGGFDPQADAIARAARYSFRQRAVLGLVLGESVLLVGIGAVLGLAFAPVAMQAVSTMSGGMMPLPSGLPPESWITGIVLMLAFGVLAGLLPALRAMRLNIVDALAGR